MKVLRDGAFYVSVPGAHPQSSRKQHKNFLSLEKKSPSHSTVHDFCPPAAAKYLKVSAAMHASSFIIDYTL